MGTQNGPRSFADAGLTQFLFQSGLERDAINERL